MTDAAAAAIGLSFIGSTDRGMEIVAVGSPGLDADTTNVFGGGVSASVPPGASTLEERGPRPASVSIIALSARMGAGEAASSVVRTTIDQGHIYIWLVPQLSIELS